MFGWGWGFGLGKPARGAAPVIASQAVSYGAFSGPTAGVVGDAVLVRTGGPVLSAAITGGDGSGHWQVAVVGGELHLRPSVAGDSADLNLGPYALTIDYGGAATAVITVNIDANAWDVYSQTDWDTVIAKSAATLSGKKIYLRPGVSLNSGVNGSAPKLRRADYGGLLIQARDFTRRPVFDKFVLRGTRNVTLDGLDTAPSNDTKFSLIAESANHLVGMTIKRCRARGQEFDPHQDFSSTPYPNNDMISTNGTASWVENLTIIDNEVTWAASAINVRCGVGQLITSGNRVKYFYDDGIAAAYPGADVPWFCEQNVVSHPIGKGSDVAGPHVDHIRGIANNSATTDWEVHVNANRLWHGHARGDHQGILLSDFKASGVDSGHFYYGELIGNVFVGDSTQGISVENAKAIFFANNTCVTNDLTPVTTTGVKIGSGSTNSTTSGTHVVQRNVSDAFVIGGSPSLADNITLGQAGATIPYATAFDGSDWNADDLAGLMATFSRKAAGPADLGGAYDAGAIGSGAITWASTVPGHDGTVNVTGDPAIANDPIAIVIQDAAAPAGNIDPNGWVAAVTFKGMAIGQALDATKISFTVSGPGYDSTGAATTVTRTVRGTKALRKAVPQAWANGLSIAVNDRVCSAAKVSGSTRIYRCTAGAGTAVTGSNPTHTSGSSTGADGITWQYLGAVTDNSPPIEPIEAVSGSDAVVYVSLDKYICAGETITACSIQAGAYGSSNASRAGIVAFANNSTRPHFRSDVAWTMMPWTLVGNTLHVEAQAIHPHGKSGRTLACMKFIVYDNSGNATAVSATVAAMTQSTVGTTTYGNPVPVFADDIDISSLADGLYSVGLEAYPFFGNVRYISGTDGFGPTGTWSASTAMTANVPKRIPFRKDSAGTFGRIYAFVDASTGNDGTGVASATLATAAASPFATISAAAAAIQTASNSTLSRNNCANHVIRMRLGSYAGFHGSSNTLPSRTMGDVWLTIERDPATTSGPADVTLTPAGSTAQRQSANRAKYREITIAGTGSPVIDNVAAASLGNFAQETWFEGCVITGNGSQAPIVRQGLMWTSNCLISGTAVMGSGNTRSGWALALGCQLGSGASEAPQFPVLNALGNKFSPKAIPGTTFTVTYWGEGTGSQTNADAHLWCFNSWYANTSNVAFPFGNTVTTGISWCQNLIESNHSTAKGGQIKADTDTLPIGHVYFMFNSSAGDGQNLVYNELGTNQVKKLAIQKFNVSPDRNTKEDYYDAVSPNLNRTGSLSSRYGVDYMANAVFAATMSAPSASNLAGEVIESRSLFSGTAGFTNDQSKLGGGAGNGDYRPTSSSSAKGMVGADEQMFPFDLNGTPRLTDGTGAAGAFEWA